MNLVELRDRLNAMCDTLQYPSKWRVMMRADLDGDVIIGWSVKDIKMDGFHQHVNLIGPAPVLKKLTDEEFNERVREADGKNKEE